ncbi:MAG: elongation factor G [Gammaproteobacteria bacterium]|nr:MAG: elongation factor G [Gammaproteobacteria bacterium]
MAAAGKIFDTKHIRNVALVGSTGSGKTTLLEAMLQRTGMIREAGSLAKGTTVSDFTAQEKRLQHSLDTAVCHAEHEGVLMNIIDTPGNPDFIGRAMSVLPGVDTAAIVINAQVGVDTVTRSLMSFAAQKKLCRLIIINRIDADGEHLEAILGDIREAFGPECLPLNLPAERGTSVADCFFELSDKKPDFSSVATAHTNIVDQVVELDEKLMQSYLEQGEELGVEQLHDSFESALRAGHLVPVCFVSAQTGAGLRQLLRILAMLMPDPTEGNPPEFLQGEGAAARVVPVRPDPAAHFVGHVFKINVDPYVGRLGVFRVHQGTVRSGDQVFIGERRKGFKVAHLYRLQGSQTSEIAQAVPGDIVAVSKVDDLHFDAVLHSSHDEDQFHLQPPGLPMPMHGVAIAPARRGDEKKLSDALHKMMAEDPSLRVEFNTHSNETVLRGVGELHVRLVLERMREEFGLEVSTQPPKIAYRETITRKAEGHSRHKKQTGGAGQFGEVYLRVEPLARGAGFEFVDEVVGGAIPGQFIPAVEKGVRQVLAEGAIAGYPLEDIRVTVYDGKHHAVDSKEVAFVSAGRKALLDAIARATPIVLEPVAKVRITAPADFVGDISGHLSGHRARINGNETASGNQVTINAEIPEAELRDYQTRLKSITGGKGSYTVSFDHYASVPPTVQKALMEAFRPRPEE